MAERDMERAEVAKATGHVGEMEQEINLLRDDREQVSRMRFLGAEIILKFRTMRVGATELVLLILKKFHPSSKRLF